MSRTQRVSALVACAVLAVVFGACGGDSEEDDGSGSASAAESYTVGVILPGVTNPYFADVRDGAAEADAAMENVTLEFGIGTADRSIPETIANIEGLLTKQVDALVVAGGEPELVPTVQGALDDDIPVVFVDGQPPELADGTPLVATDNREAGRTAGRWIVEHLGGKGKVGLLVGIPGIPVNLDRTEGAEEVLKKSDIKIVAKLPTDCDRAKGQNAADDMLTANPDIDLIYAACADPILGAVQAVKSAGLTGEVDLVGFDAQDEEIENIRAGTETASIAQFPTKMGRIGVETAVEWLETDNVPEDVDSGTTVVTEENLDQFASE